MNSTIHVNGDPRINGGYCFLDVSLLQDLFPHRHSDCKDIIHRRVRYPLKERQRCQSTKIPQRKANREAQNKSCRQPGCVRNFQLHDNDKETQSTGMNLEGPCTAYPPLNSFAANDIFDSKEYRLIHDSFQKLECKVQRFKTVAHAILRPSDKGRLLSQDWARLAIERLGLVVLNKHELDAIVANCVQRDGQICSFSLQRKVVHVYQSVAVSHDLAFVNLKVLSDIDNDCAPSGHNEKRPHLPPTSLAHQTETHGTLEWISTCNPQRQPQVHKLRRELKLAEHGLKRLDTEILHTVQSTKTQFPSLSTTERDKAYCFQWGADLMNQVINKWAKHCITKSFVRWRAVAYFEHNKERVFTFLRLKSCHTIFVLLAVSALKAKKKRFPLCLRYTKHQQKQKHKCLESINKMKEVLVAF